MTDEQEDLDQLVNSAGWQRFRQMVEQLWGSAEGGGDRFIGQMTQVAMSTDDAVAMGQMRQIIAAQREIQGVMRWPKMRLEQITRTAVPADSDATPLTEFSRRGGL